MRISKEDLEAVGRENQVPSEITDRLWNSLLVKDAGRPRFVAEHTAYYFGTMIVIAAMGWLMNSAWESFGGGGILLLAVFYAFCFARAGLRFWRTPSTKIPGGLLMTMAVSMTPLAVYGLERATGFWPQNDPGTYDGFHFWVKGGWILMELATIAVGLITIKFIRFPFLTAPIAFALWYLSMDLTPILFGEQYEYEAREWVSAGCGLIMILIAFLIDRRTKEDYAFWVYLFGVIAFWGGLSFMDSGNELGKFIYCLINIAMVFVSVLLQRKVFLVFGSLGVMGYLAHLSYAVFKDSILFPFALTVLGLGVIYAGMLYQRNRTRLETFLLRLIPAGLKPKLPGNRPTPI
jgi:hypothetical protein